MAPYKHECDSCILTKKKNGLYSKFLPVFNFIWHWLAKSSLTVKKPVQENTHSSPKSNDLASQPQFLKGYPADVDVQEVERCYNWLYTSLMEGSEADFKYRYLNVALELPKLLQEKSQPFLKTLVKRIFPTKSLSSEEFNGQEFSGQTCSTFDAFRHENGFRKLPFCLC